MRQYLKSIVKQSHKISISMLIVYLILTAQAAAHNGIHNIMQDWQWHDGLYHFITSPYHVSIAFIIGILLFLFVRLLFVLHQQEINSYLNDNIS